MRGANSYRLRLRRFHLGSPPHARGKCAPGTFSQTAQGITPACAGQMWAIDIAHGFKWDHPRMRGANINTVKTNIQKLGSPPHARGKYFDNFNIGQQFGITPACAGQIMIVTNATRSNRDHPRMRGANSSSFCKYRLIKGSPPHARGK